MAFALDAIVADVTYSLSDGNPFSLESAQGLAMAPTRRLTERAPRQAGDTDLGYRLEPRTITLSLNFYASTYAALDGYRDTLVTIFKPIRGGVIYLRVTRDDGEVRQIDCQTTGQMDIALVREERAGKLHRAVVQLRAADPVWYDPAGETISSGPGWWLANELIGTANVLTHVDYPAAGQDMALGTTIAPGSPWSIVFRTSWLNTPGVAQYAFDISEGRITPNQQIGGTPRLTIGTAGDIASYIDASLRTYLITSNGGTVIAYRDNVAVGTVTGSDGTVGIAGTARWRQDRGVLSANWQTDIPRAAIYNTALDTDQRDTLHDTISTTGVLTINSGTASVVMSGNYPVYPTMIISGPLGGLKIANATLGSTIDFTGATVNAGEVWTLDTQAKTILDTAGNSQLDKLANTQFYNWYLVPPPISTEGTNNIVVTAGSVGTAASIAIYYRVNYVSY